MMVPTHTNLPLRAFVRLNIAASAFQRDPAFQQTIDPVASGRRALDVLLDQHDRRTLSPDRRKRGVDQVDRDRCEPERYFVTEEQARISHQRAANRD
jgi:hypothetical protein